MVSRLDEGADRGRRGVENRDAVILDHFPEAAEVRCVRRAFVHHLGDAVSQRAVNDVGVPGDPADVGGAPVNILVAHVENVFAGRVGAGEVAAGGVEDSLRFAGRAGRVEDEKRVLGVEALGDVFRGNAGHFVVPPRVALGVHRDFVCAAFDDDDALDLVVFRERLIDHRLEGDDLAAPPAAVGGDDGGGAGVLEAIDDGLRGEAAEDHIVHRADARAGEHRDGGFRNHRHVNEHAVLGLDAVFEEHVGEAADVLLKLAVGDDAFVAGLALPDDGGLVFAGAGGVAVHAVFTDVELAAVEPFRVRGLPIEHFGPRFLPNQFLCLTRPELVGLVDGFLIELFVGRHRWDAGLRGKFLGRLVHGVQIVIGNGFFVAHGLSNFQAGQCMDASRAETRKSLCLRQVLRTP